MSIIDHVTIEDLLNVRNAEHRHSIKLLRYWQSLCKARLFPSENSINAEEIPEIWDNCYLIQVNDLYNRQKIDFTYLGSKIIGAYHNELNDADMTDLVSPKSSRIMQHFQLVIEEKKPILQSGEFASNAGKHIKFRQSMLPLGENDAKVEAIFGCVGFRIYN